jgi:hypothetical protein
MAEVAVEINPRNGGTEESLPAFFKIQDKSPEEVVVSLVTANGYRITVLASLAEMFTEQGYAGPMYQAMKDFSECDPRITNQHKEVKDGKEVTIDEEYVFTPRQFDMASAYYGNATDQVPKRLYLAVTKIKDFEQKKASYSPSNDLDSLGRHKTQFSEIFPDYVAQEGRGRFMKQNMKGIPVVGHAEKFHICESPFLKVESGGLPSGYDQKSVIKDLVKSIANCFEMLEPEEHITGCSVIQSNKIAGSSDTDINSLDLFFQSERSIGSKENKRVKKYTETEATVPSICDRENRSSFSQTENKYLVETSPDFHDDVMKLMDECRDATFGFYTHELTGSGRDVELVQIPQYPGEPLAMQVERVIDSKSRRLSHSQQLRNYLLVMANTRANAPSGTLLSFDKNQPDENGYTKDPRDSKDASKLVATNPQLHAGRHYKSQDNMCPLRWALFRSQVKDTEEVRREVENRANRFRRKGTEGPMSTTYFVGMHNARDFAGYNSVYDKNTGLIGIDINLARLHELEGADMKSAATLSPMVAKFVAGVLARHMDEGARFNQQRVVGASESWGGFPLYDWKQAQLYRNWIEIEGINTKVQEGKHVPFVNNYYEISHGHQGDDQILSKRTPFAVFAEHELSKAHINGQSLSHDDLKNRWNGLSQEQKDTYNKKSVKWSGDKVISENQWCEGLQRYVSVYSVDTLNYKGAPTAAVYQEQTDFVNKPKFFGEKVDLEWYDEKGNKTGEQITDLDGKPIKMHKYAFSYMCYTDEEDWAKAGVSIKRCARMHELNIRSVMYMYGYKCLRKEHKHGWEERGRFAPIDKYGRYDPNAKIRETNRSEITFYFESFFSWELDQKEYSAYLRRLPPQVLIKMGIKPPKYDDSKKVEEANKYLHERIKRDKEIQASKAYLEIINALNQKVKTTSQEVYLDSIPNEILVDIYDALDINAKNGGLPSSIDGLDRLYESLWSKYSEKLSDAQRAKDINLIDQFTDKLGKLQFTKIYLNSVYFAERRKSKDSEEKNSNGDAKESTSLVLYPPFSSDEIGSQFSIDILEFLRTPRNQINEVIARLSNGNSEIAMRLRNTYREAGSIEVNTTKTLEKTVLEETGIRTYEAYPPNEFSSQFGISYDEFLSTPRNLINQKIEELSKGDSAKAMRLRNTYRQALVVH